MSFESTPAVTHEISYDSAASRDRSSLSLVSSARARWVAAAGVLVTLVASSAAAEFRESHRFEGDSLTVANLIGSIRLEPASGSGFAVEAEMRGRDATTQNLKVEVEKGRRSTFAVTFPVDKHSRYVYPQLDGGKARFEFKQNRRKGFLQEILGAFSNERIEVTKSGRGLEVWADLVIQVPRGGELELEHGIGAVRIDNVDGQLMLKVRSGSISGETVSGEARLDVGSGSVTLTDISGDFDIDSGSGSVTVERFDGPHLRIDTGSGSIRVADVRSRELVLDTGSGNIDASSVSSESASIDSGSGGITLAMNEMGSGEFEIDTGSGSITLLVPEFASADVVADTGSGSIDVDLPDIRTLRRERDNMRFKVGRGDAQVRLDTGSGRIRIATAD